MPAIDGAVMEVSRSHRTLAKEDPDFGKTLQLLWFGSSCHEIRLGELSIVTDPFVSNGPLFAKLKSKSRRVQETFAKLHPPAAVLVNHGHHDHVLDAHAALSEPDWKTNRVPLYGGRTAIHIIGGWGDPDVDNRCEVVEAGPVLDWTSANQSRIPPGYKLRVTAYRGSHSPHVSCGKVFNDGYLTSNLPAIPDTLGGFQCGEVFNYLVEMEHAGIRFKIFLLGGPGDPANLPAEVRDLDVLILPAPGAEHLKRKHPLKDHLARLRPRHIVIDHFNSFTKEDPDEQLSILKMDTANLQWLSRELQQIVTADGEHSRFEKLHLPAISRMEAIGRARNIILIKKARERN